MAGQSLLSLTFNYAALISGFFLAQYAQLLMSVPWGMAAFPMLLTVRGVVMGMYVGRTSTYLHTGGVLPRFRRNTETFAGLNTSLLTLSVISSVLVALFLLPSAGLGGLWDAFHVITMGSFLIVFLGIIPTLFLMFHSFKVGIDPDVISYPVLSSTTDILATLGFIFVLFIYFVGGTGRQAVVALALICITVSAALSFFHRENSVFLRTVREVMFTFLLIVAISAATGQVFDWASRAIEELESIYFLYPSLIDGMGDYGSIVGSILTTKFALGLLKPELGKAIRGSLAEISGAITAVLFQWTTFVIIPAVVYGLDLDEIFRLAAVLFGTLLVMLVVVTLFVTSIAILTFRRGLNPDNFVIPLETTLCDLLVTVTVFLFALIFW